MRKRTQASASTTNMPSQSEKTSLSKHASTTAKVKNTAREKNVAMREVAVATREQEVSLAKSAQSNSDKHLRMLQEANAHLVIVSIEAQKMTEQALAAQNKLDHIAHHDKLTDLPNRVLLQDRLTHAIDLANRQSRQLAVMYMDLDQFKYINDSLGHAAGDKLLQSVARRLGSCVRHSDTISRQGGDEFVLLLTSFEHIDDAARAAEKILKALARPHLIDEHELYIGISIGISIYPDDGEDAESLLKYADTAMYHAKENGRNNYKFFESCMNVRAVERQFVEAGLRRALERDELVLHYQPKINLYSGLIVGVEALVRWQHPERGMLLPAQFIRIAEDCGLILSIGRWVLRTACRQAQLWQKAGLPPITIAVNTSALEFRAKDFISNIQTTLEESQLHPKYLELEMTESILMRDAKSAQTVLRALSDMGVKLAIDDFGTGYSSLSYLNKFSIDTLKIDQSFVKELTDTSDDAILVKAVISMGNSLKNCVLAEGVETVAQYAFLLAQHCDEGQGNYFSRPLAAQECTQILRDGIAKNLLHDSVL